MKKGEIFFFSLLFLGATFFAVYVVLTALTDLTFTSPKALVEQFIPHKSEAISRVQCSDQPKNDAVSGSVEVHLKKLAEYQQACESFVTNELMVFTDMPKDANDARTRADAMVTTLTEFKKAGVKPLIIVEPVTDWGLIDFKEFGTGFYDDWINTYFQELKVKGITDEDMGTWVPFPEANLPYWNNKNATPADFSAIVNRYLHIMKNNFPNAKGSILLNSATYDTNDFEWSSGEYISLQDYVKGIDKGLVQSFGLQGFSWMPSAKQVGTGIFNAAEYLNPKLATEAADILGVKDIWFNTGSFSRKYTLDPTSTAYLSAAKRKDVLTSILTELKKAQSAGYNVSVNLFAQDKSTVAEATDWSYWGSEGPDNSTGTPVFTAFANQVNQAGIHLSLFDIAP